MGNKYQLASLVESRRVLWLIALMFAVVFLVQYFELPYGNDFLSLVSFRKAKVESVGNFSVGNSARSFSVGELSHNENLTFSNGLNSTDPSTSHETLLSDGKDTNEKHADDSFESDADSDPEDESPSKDFVEINHDLTVAEAGGTHSLAPGKVWQYHTMPASDSAPSNTVSLDSKKVHIFTPTLVGNGTVKTSLSNPSDAIRPLGSPLPFGSPAGAGIDSGNPSFSFNYNTSSVNNDAASTLQKIKNPGIMKSDFAPYSHSSGNSIPKVQGRTKAPENAVVSLSEMNDMLLQSLTSYHSMKPRWTSGADQDLMLVKSLIQNASNVQNDAKIYAPLFRNFSMFHRQASCELQLEPEGSYNQQSWVKRSYELMEQILKVYVYKEGERPIFHQPMLKGIYASEGWFMKQLKASKRFVTKNPKEAQLFYLPFSTRRLEETLYVPNSPNLENLVDYLNDYLNLITRRYSFWNRTEGADHFLIACHDWAPSETRQIMAHCIRALCNSDIKEGFQFGKDVSLAETYVRSAQNPLRALGGQSPSKRQILAFFAGNMHGYLRPILLKYWENTDPDMKIYGRMPKAKGQMNYVQHMKSSKYCICAKGYEVNSPRVVEAIFYECVPVIISDNFVPPFFETLNWESFAVFVLEKDIPNLKNILLSIPEKTYLQMQSRVKMVQQHFLWHSRPVKYDIFHMILHSIWYTRVFQTSSW